MKKILDVLYTVLCHFALSFSGIILFFWCFMSQGHDLKHHEISNFLSFAVIFGITYFVYVLPKLPYSIKVILHFIINFVSFIYFFAVSRGVNQVQVFIAGVMFIIIYAGIFAIVKGLQALAKRLTKNV